MESDNRGYQPTLVLQPGIEPVPGYRLVKRLGGGRFAEVWKAKTHGGFLVAMKFVRLGKDFDVGEIRSLELEAVKSIRHPNLLVTFGAWQVADCLIIAMELADKTLWDRFQEARAQGMVGIPGDELHEYMLEAAKGLDYLNEHRYTLGGRERVGCRHRDVKPQHILLVGAGVKIADFGLARILNQATASHTGLMTVAYAAPEFFHNQACAQSDQYSLAVSYCELRGGRLPFDGSVAQIVQGHLYGEPDLQMLPVAERPAVARALAKEPERRWPCSCAFAEALRACQTEPVLEKATSAEAAVSNQGEDASEVFISAFPSAPPYVPPVAMANLPAASAVARPRPRYQNKRRMAPADTRPPAPLPTGRQNGRRPPFRWAAWATLVTLLAPVAIAGAYLMSVVRHGGIGEGPAAQSGMTLPTERGVASGPPRLAPVLPPFGKESLPVVPPVPSQAPNGKPGAEAAPGREPEDDCEKASPSAPAVDMKMVLIPAGEFLMGSGESAESLVGAFEKYGKPSADFFNFKDEYPQHRVRITQSFYLGAYEVTVGQFRQFVQETGYKTDGEKDAKGGRDIAPSLNKTLRQESEETWRDPGFPQTDEHPVVNVSWNDAVEFCKWLSREEGKTYRLPTEAEWEYACRAGAMTRYWHGDDPEGLALVGNVSDAAAKTEFPAWVAISTSDGYVFSAPVGQFRPNAFGLYDMHGNVWEWCADWHSDGYYSTSPVEDPVGSDFGTLRILRGGSWFLGPYFARSTCRNMGTSTNHNCNTGFRVARTP